VEEVRVVLFPHDAKSAAKSAKAMRCE
jgi:hypothetical protein